MIAFHLLLFSQICREYKETYQSLGCCNDSSSNSKYEVDGAMVTTEPCPAYYDINGTHLATNARPENGCIYLGVFHDDTSAFSQLNRGTGHNVEVMEFWALQNKKNTLKGKSGAFSVAIRISDNTNYDMSLFAPAYEKLAPSILAIAQIFVPLLPSDGGRIQEDGLISAQNVNFRNQYSGCYYEDVLFSTWSKWFKTKPASSLGYISQSGMQEPTRKIASEYGLTTTFDTLTPVAASYDLLWGVCWLQSHPWCDIEYQKELSINLVNKTREEFRANPTDIVYADAPFPVSMHIISAVEDVARELNVEPVYFTWSRYPENFYASMYYDYLPYGPFENALNRTFIVKATESWNADTLGHYEREQHLSTSNFSEMLRDGKHNWFDFRGEGWESQYNLLALLKKVIDSGDAVTRENLKAQIPDLEIDYKGMLPPKKVELLLPRTFGFWTFDQGKTVFVGKFESTFGVNEVCIPPSPPPPPSPPTSPPRPLLPSVPTNAPVESYGTYRGLFAQVEYTMTVDEESFTSGRFPVYGYQPFSQGFIRIDSEPGTPETLFKDGFEFLVPTRPLLAGRTFQLSQRYKWTSQTWEFYFCMTNFKPGPAPVLLKNLFVNDAQTIDPSLSDGYCGNANPLEKI